MQEMSSCDAAASAWREALADGAVAADAVADDAKTLDRYAQTTLAHGTRPCCVLYPESTEAVQKVVGIAATHGVPVYPISRGRNWGYGDACAPADGMAIVDLSRMDRIVEVNDELAYAVVEPGVSQRAFHAHLSEHHAGLWFDASGAGLDASLVGNTVDRGFGHTRYGDHFATTCGMEIVLADGRVLNTGFGHYPNAKASRAYRYGLGPALDGLFCQSNYGIVTKIGLWLVPAPEAFNFFYITVPRHEDLAPLIDALRPLRMGGILDSAVHIGNDLRLLSANGRYPWEEAGDQIPLPEALRVEMRRPTGMGAWNVAGSLTGTAAHVRASRKALRRAVGHLGKIGFVGDTKLALGEWAASVLRKLGMGDRITEQLRTLKPNYGLLKGIPTDEPLRGAQWRLRHPPGQAEAPDDAPGSPLDLGCGLMWASPVLPATGRDATQVMAIAEPILREFDFEPLVTFTMITERAMVGILNVVFDKTVPSESEKADRCYHRMLEALRDAGYIPYRVGLSGFDTFRSPDDVFWQVAGQIKRALDPNDIIAPGRYVPPQPKP